MFFLKFLVLILCVMISVAFITLLERKILSLVGLRLGPNKVSFLGILQPITDAVKLSNKSVNLLSNFSLIYYYFSSFFSIFSSLLLWMIYFNNPSLSSFKYVLIFVMLILGFNSFNSILAGWSVFSKYCLIGSMRTVAQLVSYEASLYLCLFFFFLLYNSFSLLGFDFFLLFNFVLFIPFCFYIWIPSFLAELNRSPYDFSEGESELVSGFNTEFGSGSFTLLFLAEYSNIIFMCLLSSFLFFFSEKIFFFFFFFLIFVIWIRSVVPRFRFDKLMMLAWKFFIPFLSILFVLFIFIID